MTALGVVVLVGYLLLDYQYGPALVAGICGWTVLDAELAMFADWIDQA